MAENEGKKNNINKAKQNNVHEQTLAQTLFEPLFNDETSKSN
jgi:hypothetical protein